MKRWWAKCHPLLTKPRLSIFSPILIITTFHPSLSTLPCKASHVRRSTFWHKIVAMYKMGNTYNESTANPHNVSHGAHNCSPAKNLYLFLSNAKYLVHEKQLPCIELQQLDNLQQTEHSALIVCNVILMTSIQHYPAPSQSSISICIAHILVKTSAQSICSWS